MAARVLAIDDDPSTLAFLDAALRDLGWTVDCATTPHDACALLATSEPYDVVLSDAFRTSRTDYGWLDQLRRATGAPIVIISAWPAEDFSDERARGYTAFLAKPFDLDELTALVMSFWPPQNPPLRLAAGHAATEEMMRGVTA